MTALNGHVHVWSLGKKRCIGCGGDYEYEINH